MLPITLLKKLATIAFSLLIMSMLIFIIVEMMPGDITQVILGQSATPEAIENLRKAMGLNQPSYIRYFTWLVGMFRGDFGESLFMQGVKIGPLIFSKTLNSFLLAGCGMLFVVPLSLFLGIWAGLHEGKLSDHLISTIGIISLSMPGFVSGVILMTILSVQLGWLPLTSNIPIGSSIFGSLDRLVLPAMAVTMVIFGYLSRMVRASMITVMSSQYIRAAILRGLPMWQVVFGHALKNALLPAITVIGMNFGWMLGGLVVVETLFAFPGIGFLTMTAVTTRDLPLLEICVLIVTFVYMLSNFFTDMLYSVLNPRIRYQ
jgi:peptide/nickel transport system permease protein